MCIFTLNINIPENEFGLIMFYYIEDDKIAYDKTKAAYIKAYDSNGKKVNDVRQFNVNANFTNKYG